MTKDEIGELIGDFTYCWGCDFFIETEKGNFIWLNSEYPGGDNSIQKTSETYNQFAKRIQIPIGRLKGKHKIKDYCGDFYVKS